MPEVFPRDVLLRVNPRTLGRLPYTFARADASTCATYIDRDGMVRLAAANKVRIEWVDLDGDGVRETPGILLEGSRQNMLLRSEEIDNVAWSATTVTVSANADVAPDGTTTADRLIEGALSQEHVKYQTLAGTTADVRHSSSIFAKAGTRSFLVMTIRDLNSPTGMVIAWFNLTTGAVGTVSNTGVGSGAQAFMVKLANGWYRCFLVGAQNAGDTTPVVTFGVANANGTQIYAGDGASYISLWGAQFEKDTPIPSSYIKTVAAAVTRTQDALTVPFNFGLMDTTIAGRIARPIWADLTGTIGQNPAFCDLGQGANIHNRLYGLTATRQFQADIQAGGPNSFGIQNIPAGASLAAVAQYKNYATGGQTALDVGTGLSAFGSAAAIGPKYGSQVLGVGGMPAGGEPLYGVLLDLMFCRGLFSHAEMSAIR